MKSHELPSIRKKPTRVGRGGKRGTTSGRGTKGQRSRAGHRIRPAERDLILRLPKKRGFRNKPQSLAALVFNVGPLSEHLKRGGHEKGVTVTREFLVAAELLAARDPRPLKVLGSGDIEVAFSVKGIPVSKEAREKITKAGGSVA